MFVKFENLITKRKKYFVIIKWTEVTLFFTYFCFPSALKECQYKFCKSFSSFFFLFLCNSPLWARASFTRFVDYTQRRTTVGRTYLDEWSARRRDLYLTTRNIRNRQTYMPPVEFEPIISGGKRLQTSTSDHVATGTISSSVLDTKIQFVSHSEHDSCS